MNIYLASGSNLKIRAVQTVVNKLKIDGKVLPLNEFSNEKNQTQPIGFKEIINTAERRLEKAKSLAKPDWDFIVVLENGLVDTHDECYDIAYCIITNKEGNIEQSFSNATFINKDIAKEVKNGRELGPLIQQLYGVKEKDPSIVFTNGKVKREDILSFLVENTLSRYKLPIKEQKTIALCGSTVFYDDMDKIQLDLEKLGLKVLHPKQTGPAYSADLKDLYKAGKHKRDMAEKSRETKRKLITSHMIAIQNSDAILVVNLEKNGQKNYIGGNVFLEMGFAFAYGKEIYVLNNLPDYSAYLDEISGLLPKVINNDLSLIH